MKINHEKRRLLGSLRDPFPQLNTLRETVYKMNSTDQSSGHGGVRRIMDYRATVPTEPSRINRPSIAPTTATPATNQTSIAAQTFSAITSTIHSHDTTDMDLEQSVIRELKRIQEDLKRQRNETKVLTDYVSAIAQEVRQVRTQLHVISDK